MARRTATPSAAGCATGSPFLSDRLLPLRQVIEVCGLSKAMIYRLMRRGGFPKAYKPGGHASRWSEREVQTWLAEVAEQRR